MKRFIGLLFGLVLYSTLFAQQTSVLEENRLEELKETLDNYSSKNNSIKSKVDIAFSGSIQEVVKYLAQESKVNITIDEAINQYVVLNFTDVPVRDILYHLCQRYALDLRFSGSIIDLIAYDSPEAPPKEAYVPKVMFNQYNQKVELDLKRDTLDRVLRELSKQSKKNIVSSQKVSERIVNGYVGASELKKALDLIALRNNLEVNYNEEDDFYIFSDKDIAKAQRDARQQEQELKQQLNKRSAYQFTPEQGLFIDKKVDSIGNILLDVDAEEIELAKIVRGVGYETGKDYYLFEEPKGKITFHIKDATYEEVLNRVFQGTDYSFQNKKGRYLIGKREYEGLRDYSLKQLYYRSSEDITSKVPQELRRGLDIIELPEYNSLALFGAQKAISELEEYLYEIDRDVPVVNIELIILDVTNTDNINIGISTGIGENPAAQGGTLTGNTNFTFNALSINNLLKTIEGRGISNLGRVTENFYLTLNAVEDKGYVKVRSKPRLSTLNSEEATLNISETRYYLQEDLILTGNLSPVQQTTRRFQPVTADFSITVTPYVAGNENVTLDVDVTQSDFTDPPSVDAPPGQVSRQFNSKVKVQNQEMIVLGGLEEKRTSRTTSGVPFLSKIPVIKWFFGNNQSGKNNSKLLIFIKPTIIY